MKPIERVLMGISFGLSLSMMNPEVSLSQVPPYGPLINQYNSQAASAISRGDYDTAIINYQKAAEAAKELDEPILRICGFTGAIANLNGSQAAKNYLQEMGRNPTTLEKALKIEDIVFRAYWDIFDVKYPQLENRCP